MKTPTPSKAISTRLFSVIAPLSNPRVKPAAAEENAQYRKHSDKHIVNTDYKNSF